MEPVAPLNDRLNRHVKLVNQWGIKEGLQLVCEGS